MLISMAFYKCMCCVENTKLFVLKLGFFVFTFFAKENRKADRIMRA